MSQTQTIHAKTAIWLGRVLLLMTLPIMANMAFAQNYGHPVYKGITTKPIYGSITTPSVATPTYSKSGVYVMPPIQRKFPKTAKKGHLEIVSTPAGFMPNQWWVRINRTDYAVSPDLKIYDTRQAIIFGSQVKVPTVVAYLMINQTINRIWILREEEISNFSHFLFD